MSIELYGNKKCSHCNWILGKKSPFCFITETNTFLGMTVFDSHTYFKNSFNCVYGLNGLNSSEYHNYMAIGELLTGVDIFINDINKNFNINKFNVLVNSHFDPIKYGRKEHPHAIVTITDSSKISSFFKFISGKANNRFKKKVALKPFYMDTVIVLNKDEIFRLFLKDSILFISHKLSDILGYKFNFKYNNFYIFLTYDFIDGVKDIKVKISTDLKIFNKNAHNCT